MRRKEAMSLCILTVLVFVPAIGCRSGMGDPNGASRKMNVPPMIGKASDSGYVESARTDVVQTSLETEIRRSGHPG